MGNLLSCKCETCLLNKEQEVNDNKYQKRIPISQKSSRRNIIFSPTTNINIITRSNNIEQKDISISLDDSIKRTNDSKIIQLLNILISNQFYEKLIKGERLHNLLEFLYIYNNTILFNLLLYLLFKIKNILNDSIYLEYKTKEIYTYFMKEYLNLIDNNILDDIKKNIEEDYRIKYNLIDVLESSVELYHFFYYKIFKGRSPYNIFYWEQYKNYYNYIEQKIGGIKDGIININLSLGDNKLKIIG